MSRHSGSHSLRRLGTLSTGRLPLMEHIRIHVIRKLTTLSKIEDLPISLTPLAESVRAIMRL